MTRRTEAVRRVAGWLARGVLLGFWCLLGWGTLLLLASVPGAWHDGVGVAIDRLLPPPGASLWAWLNALSVLLASAAWVMAAGYAAWTVWPTDGGGEAPGD